MLAEYLRGPRLFAHVGEEMAKSEDMPNFMDHGLHLLLAILREHPRIDSQFMPTRIGKESACQDASVGRAIIDTAHNDFEVPSIVPIRELDGRRITPG